MIDLTAIDVGKARGLMNLRSFAATILALAMSLVLPLGAAAQESRWDLEIVIGEDGNTTYFRCTSAADFAAQTNDCSDNQAAWDCNGEVIAVVRDELGGCNTRVATLAETLTLITQHEQLVDLLIAGLFPEEPGAEPEDEEDEDGQVDSTSGSSTESFQTQVIDSTPNVTTPPPFTPPGPPPTVPP